MTDLKSMTLEEMQALLKSWGEPSFRAGQVFTWLHKGVTSFDEMSNLPKALREKLAGECILTRPTVERKQVSAQDGTIKYLWKLADGNCIETVLMRYQHGNTVCISCQVGCRMGCAFCASTLGGRIRNLTPAEMLDQVLFTQLDSGSEISNIVLMGIGEPLDNFDTVLRFLEHALAPDGAAWVAEPGRSVYEAFLHALHSGGWQGRRVHTARVEPLYAQPVPVTVQVWEIRRRAD